MGITTSSPIGKSSFHPGKSLGSSPAGGAVHALVDDDALGGYAAKADFLVHSPQQVRVLLDVEG